MTNDEKSLKIAELMGWKGYYTDFTRHDFIWDCNPDFDCTQYKLEPYEKSEEGLAQFAAILLKFSDIMQRFGRLNGVWHIRCKKHEITEREPTQANILDEILRMNGVMK